MFQKLFNISVVFFVAVFSILGLVLVFSGLASSFLPSVLSDTQGISIGAGGLDLRLILAAVCAVAALAIAGILIFLGSRN